MFKRFRYVCAAVVGASLLIAGCGSNDDESAQSGGGAAGSSSSTALKGKTIWYVGLSDGIPADVANAQGANHAITGGNGKMIREIAINPTTGKLDVATQTQAFARAIAAKPAAIIYFALSAEGMGPQVKQARAAGIPVFAVKGHPVAEIPVNGWSDLDNVGQGREIAKYMAANVPKGTKVTVIAPPAGIAVAEQLTQAAMQEFKGSGLTFVGNYNQQRDQQGNPAGGQAVMQAILQKEPDVGAVFAYSDEIALGAIAAARAGGRQPGKDIFFGGRNGGAEAAAAVKAGTLMVTCDIDPPLFMENVVRAVTRHLDGTEPIDDGEEIPPPKRDCLVTKDNIDTYKDWEDRIPYTELDKR